MTIGVSELQKNISIFKNLTESVQVVDKKTKEVLAFILPKSQMEQTSLTDSLAGILQQKEPIDSSSINKMIEDAYEAQMREKHGK